MRSWIKTYWLPVVVLFVVFFDELFNCSAILKGFTVESGMKQYEAMLLAAIGYTMIIFDFLNCRIRRNDHRVLVAIFILFTLYILTSYFYDGSPHKYSTYLLVFGAECIPSAYIGIRLAKSYSFNRINEILPFVVIPISILIGTIGVAATLMGTTVGEADYQEGGDSGLNYQTLSYYMAFSYAYAFYIVFYCNWKSWFKNFLIKFAMALDMLFCLAICLTGGGRGAFVYIIAITIFLVLYYLKSSNKRIGHSIIIVVFLIMVSLYLGFSLGIMQSSGMERVTNNLMEDNDRIGIYLSSFDVFLSSPIIGKGVGSIWWTVGSYSHNIILDLLAETGLIGTFIFLGIIWRTIIKLFRLCKIDNFFIFILLVMAGNLANCMFSGYYIAAFKIYFVCAFVYCLTKNNNNLVKV